MFAAKVNSPIKNTNYRVVVPFYAYAAVSFLIACLLVFVNPTVFTVHYFHPHTLAITHTMALGWGSMMILGASHQLFPVMIEGKLFSNTLAYLSFGFTGIGIPVLVFAFFVFNLGLIAQIGGILINLGLLCYLVNLWVSLSKTKKTNIHALFAFTAVLWLLFTTLLGLLLVYNFSLQLFSESSLHYLSLHAHIGIVGWFLLMIIGVGSRLIPMFLISKHENSKQLNWIFGLINIGLLAFIFLFIYLPNSNFFYLPIGLIGIAVLLFVHYLYQCFRKRIRKKVDGQVKISLLSTVFILIPIVILAIVVTLYTTVNNQQLIMLYGFIIFFGWITAIIIGMTFKTLPFIIWNKVYSAVAGLGKTPNPKELFSKKLFLANGIFFLLGIGTFSFGIVLSSHALLNIGATFLLLTAIFYNLNLFKILFHKRKINVHKNE